MRYALTSFYLLFTLAVAAQLPAPRLDCAATESGEVRLTWTNTTSNCGPYEATEIYQATAADGPYTRIAELADPTATEYVDDNPSSELRYYYLRYRYACPGQAATSSDTLDSAIPAIPRVRYVELREGQLIIDWAPSSSPEVVGYIVLEVLPTQFVVLDTVRTATRYAETVAAGSDPTRREFRLVAFDRCGNLSPQSAILRAADLELGGAEVCVSTIVLRPDQAALERYAPLSGLELFVSTNGGGFVSAGTVAPTATNLAYQDANDGDELCFYLEAVLAGDGARARSASGCLTADLLQPVRDFPLYGVSVAADGSLDLQYADSGPAPEEPSAELRVERGSGTVEAITLTQPIFGTGGRATLGALATPLQPGQSLRLRVADGCQREVTTNAVQPVFLSATALPDGSNQLRWTPLVNNLAGRITYDLRLVSDDGTPGPALVTDQAAAGFLDNTAADPGERCYQVTARYRPDSLNPLRAFEFTSNVVCVTPATQVYLPNALNPRSAEATNRVFQPFFNFPPPAEGYSLRVFDRWGGLRFETNDPTAGWDGTAAGEAAPAGAYLYLLEFTDNTGLLRQRNGTVNLLR